MKTSMYQTSIPTFTRVLNNLGAILEKAAAHSEARKIDPAALLGARLFPDMFPLTRQVQLAADTASGGAARLTGADVPSHDNSETSFADLIGRLKKTVAQLETIKPEQIDGTEDKTVSWQTRSSTKSMQGLPYLLNHVLPNLFFHATTAYNILRHNGVELGKMDYLGRS
ncbi:MAG TPA: DUF1993 domain-containing protein [Steroidobacteraceae bacterium]|jgi:hypothetical protein|nr:DUF1993 domain-containing protein [Steroidobacteraceae bacterium]